MINGSEVSENPLRAFVPVEEPLPVWHTLPSPSKKQADQADTPSMSVVRAIVVDDHGVVRRSLRRDLRFETDLEVIGEASSAEAGLILAQEQHPDIVIMDVEMPHLEGLDAAERLHAMAPDCVLILLATRYSADVHIQGKAAGARVVMEKGNPEVFRNTLHDLTQFVKARNAPAWPEAATQRHN
jgi:CheY-like chemotaxis protein